MERPVMELWDNLVKTALVGTGRQTPGPFAADGALGEALAKLPATDPAEALLSAAAVVGAYVRAGRLPPKRAEAVLQPPCPAESQPRLSPRAAHFLAAMVGGDHRQVLPEFLSAVAAAGHRVPEEWLPRLLELGRTVPPVRRPLLGVLGRRGQWLAAQNPDWAYLAGDAEDESSWETAGKASRLAMLGRLRQTRPARALELIASTWAKESADDRAEFLRALATGLSEEDEPFLEQALDDRGRDVRRAAADLLARLTNSRFVARMWERVAPLLNFVPGRKARIEVTLPGEPDAAAQRDGIEPKPPRGGIGQKQWWLFQLAAAAPPAAWSQAWTKTPTEILAANKGEWEDLLLEAWLTAAHRFGDVAWAEALFPLQIKIKFAPGGVQARAALPALPPHRRAALLSARLRSGANVFDDDSLTFAMLRACPGPWTEELSRAVLDMARASVDAKGQQNWVLRASLKEFAERIPPALAAEAARGWPTDAKTWDGWKSGVEGMVTLLQFRQDMLQAASEGG